MNASWCLSDQDLQYRQLQHVNLRMRYSTLNSILVLSLLIALTHSVTIEKGWITLQTKTGEAVERLKVDLSSSLKQVLNLTQSSIVKIQSKITFSKQGFLPQFVSFRLRHNKYQSLSEPVLAQWNSEYERFDATIDLGDPKHITHLSGQYRLQVIISDDRLTKQVRKYIANTYVNFRFSLDQPKPSELAYKEPSIILTEAPPKRVDPPQIFTGFVTILIVVLFVLFLWGLNYQKVNLNLFPVSGTGFIFNIFFVGCLSLVLFILVKFWINWTFIQTIQWVTIVILPFALAANYAFVHIKKD